MAERVLDSHCLYESTEHYLIDQLNQSESFEQDTDAMDETDWIIYTGDQSVVAFENEGLKTKLRYYYSIDKDYNIVDESISDLSGEVHIEDSEKVEVAEMEFPGSTHPGVELRQMLEAEGEKDILKA